MRVVITAFQARANVGTEAGLAWQWATAYTSRGYQVTVVTQNSPAADGQDTDWDAAGIALVRLGESRGTQAPQGVVGLLKAGRNYEAWRRLVLSTASTLFAEADIVHHVSWGSVRLLPPFPVTPESPGSTQWVWGPLGGGQHAILRGLSATSIPAELFRSSSFPLARARLSSYARRATAVPQTISTNAETSAFLKQSGFSSSSLMLADGVPESLVIKTREIGLRKELRLVWLGRLVPSKRPDVALRVLAELRRMDIPAHLSLAGEGPMAKSLLTLAAKLRLGDSYEQLGRVPWELTPQLYDNSDILLFHSMRDSSCPAVLEAASRGIPTVGLRVQGFGSVIPTSFALGPTRMRGSASLASELARACASLFLDEEAYRHASSSALVFARTETWDAKVSRIVGNRIGVPQ